MATHANGEGSFSDRSKILIQDRHFFKVVVFPFDKGLKIPDSFMTKYGRDLQDKVLLKLPNGASWQVELVRYGNGTLLQNGWKEFAEYYSIKMFFFLVFRYKGNSQFDVLIFDPSALEIEYPVEPNTDSSESCFQTSGLRVCSDVPSGLKVLDDDNDEEYEEICAQILKKDDQRTPASKGKRVRVEILDDISHRKQKTKSSQKLTTEKLHSTRKKTKQNQDGNSGFSNKGKSSVGTRKPLGSSTSISVHRRVINKKNFKSYEKAKAFTSSNPFFFVFMQPSYVTGKYNLEIPKDFVERYLSSKNKCSHVTLHVSERKISWPVTLFVHCYHVLRVRIGTGWKKFAQDNGLQVGDVCVFERVPGPGTMKFKVTIYYSSTQDEIVP